MLPEAYTLKDLLEEIHEDCKYLLIYCCDARIAHDLYRKYNELRSEFKAFQTCRGIELALHCTEMTIALDRVIRHGDIISVSYDNDLVTILYADGFISSVMTLLAHYYSLENPACTYVDMEDPSTDKGFRVLITNDEYIAFSFCCNCYTQIPENIHNLGYIIAPYSDFLIDVATSPNLCKNKYGPYTESEYHFVSTL